MSVRLVTQYEGRDFNPAGDSANTRPHKAIPCPAKKNCNRNFALTFLILIRWSCASDMFECMVPRYCGVVFAVKEFRNVANGSVEFQGHEKKVVQLASASSGLFRMYGTLDQFF